MKLRFSVLAILISLLTVAYLNNEWKPWRKTDGVIIWDVTSYYAYLPLTFIYNDIKGENFSKLSGPVKNKIWFQTDNDKNVIKTSLGTSLFYLPFFSAAILAAKANGYPVDGYSVPFQFAITLSSIFFFIAGLFVLRKFLLNYFSETVTGFTLLLVGLGTNIIRYLTIEAGMSHPYSFFLFSCFIYLTDKYYRNAKISTVILLGLTGGLIILVRPTNILIFLLFLLFGVSGLPSFKERVTQLLRNYHHLLIIGLMIILVWSPQLIYWKYVTGSWFYFSYGDERFYFNKPHLIEGLFGYRKGWLLYTPVMAVSLAGMYLLRDKLKGFLLPILVFTALNIFVILSWWCWWYGGSFGHRAFIDSYPLYSIPLAAALTYISTKSWIKRIPMISAMFFLFGLNIFQNIQYHTGAIHWDDMTKEAYWDSFGRVFPSKNFFYLTEPIDYDRAKAGEL